MSVNNSSWGTQALNGWQSFGHGILTFGLTNNVHTLILSSPNGPFSIVGQLSDPRFQFDPVAGQPIVEVGEPLQLQFACQWLSTSGSVDVLLGSQIVLHLTAPAVLTNGFTQVSLILTGLSAEASDTLNLTFQLNTAGPDQFQLGMSHPQGIATSPRSLHRAFACQSICIELELVWQHQRELSSSVPHFAWQRHMDERGCGHSRPGSGFYFGVARRTRRSRPVLPIDGDPGKLSGYHWNE